MNAGDSRFAFFLIVPSFLGFCHLPISPTTARQPAAAVSRTLRPRHSAGVALRMRG
jgi:hypothetical protein